MMRKLVVALLSSALGVTLLRIGWPEERVIAAIAGVALVGAMLELRQSAAPPRAHRRTQGGPPAKPMAAALPEKAKSMGAGA